MNNSAIRCRIFTLVFLGLFFILSFSVLAGECKLNIDQSRLEMVDFLQDSLQSEKGWVKVHAAEALLQNGISKKINGIFQQELLNDDPQYRIGVIRVLVNTPETSKAKKGEYVQKIREAFEDVNGKARVHAIETLGKLDVYFCAPKLNDFAAKIGGGRAAYGRWVLANSKKQADMDYLTELLESDDQWEIANVGYSIRYIDSIDIETIKRLEKCFNGLNKKSPARIYILSALCKHVKDINKKQRLGQLLKQYLLIGNNDDKKEACVAIVNLKPKSALDIMLKFFAKESDIDLKIFAADAYLKLSSIKKQVGINDDWPVDRKYRLKVNVNPKTVAKVKNAPFRVTIDFEKYLKQKVIRKDFDPKSVVVAVIDNKTGAQIIIDHLMDESFQIKDAGWVGWNIDDPGQNHFAIYFDTVENGSFKTDDRYVPMIGFGDNPRYNNPGQLSPIHAHGIAPVSGDFDGDGLVDIVSPKIYTDTWGQPGFTFRFWKNIASNDKPVFADFVRLHADGKIINNGYNNCELFDWNKDGRLDLIASSGVYLNSGKLTSSGAPLLEKINGFNFPNGKQFRGLRDVDGDGDLDAVFMYYGAHYIYEGNPAMNFIKTGLYVALNAAGKNRTPRLGPVKPLFLKNPVRENVIISDIYDFNFDGRPDVVGTSMPLDKNPPRPKLCYFPNISRKRQEHKFGRMKIFPKGEVLGSTLIKSSDNKAFNGIFVSEGHRVRYFEKEKDRTNSKIPNHVDKGLLMQVNGRCGVDGYSGVEVKDWEGDGDWDFIAGDEMGHVWLIKNIGDNDRPVFETACHIKADDKPIRVLRWNFIKDGNPEYFLGQSKPRYVDFDGDGDFDLIVANNADGLAFFENIGTRQVAEFSGMQKIKVNQDVRPFADRNRPAVLDWDGDGITDIVTKDKNGYLGLFRGIKDAKTSVRPIRKFKYDNGSEIKLGALGSMLWQWEACDWDGDGDYDLISQVGSWGNSGPGLYENVGTNAEPEFKQAVRIKCFGKDIHLSKHETTFACVDWYGQGKPDLFCGGESGWFYFFRRAALDAATPPSCRLADELEVKK